MPEETETLVRKTYLLSAEVVDKVAQMAGKEEVGVSELFRFLVLHSIREIEQGKLKLPIKEVTFRKIQMSS